MEEGFRDDMTESDLGGRACGGCITRRAFVANTAALAAATAFLSACGDGQIGSGVTGPSGAKQIKVGDFAGLATVNTIVMVDGVRAVKRSGPTAFAAYSRVCPHAGEIVDTSGTGFLCVPPGHGSRFDNNGALTLGPANRDLTKLATTYDPATDLLTIG